MKEPVLITGCARSGTSMVAGIVHKHGFFGGKMSPPNANNKKGMFENEEIRDHIVKPFLSDCGLDPLCQDKLPARGVHYPYEGLRDTITSIMKKQGLKENEPWFYKGAKMCLFWQTWKEAFPMAKWIIVRRPDEAIVKSCLKTHFMRKRETFAQWMDWVVEHKIRFEEIKHECNCMEVWSDKLISGQFYELSEVLKWVGADYRQEIVDSFVDPSLYHFK